MAPPKGRLGMAVMTVIPDVVRPQGSATPTRGRKAAQTLLDAWPQGRPRNPPTSGRTAAQLTARPHGRAIFRRARRPDARPRPYPSRSVLFFRSHHLRLTLSHAHSRTAGAVRPHQYLLGATARTAGSHPFLFSHSNNPRGTTGGGTAGWRVPRCSGVIARAATPGHANS